MQTRSEFLAAGGSALAAAIPSTIDTPAPLPSGFALRAFDAALMVAARHKHLFTSITDSGDALGAVRSTINGYRDVGIAVTDVHAAVVFYHGAAVLNAFDDGIWNRYVIPSKVLSTNAASGNPMRSEIQGLVTVANVSIFACNLATHGYASKIAKAMRLSADTVYADMAAHLSPNTMLAPAGVWAIHAIQERGYTLLQYA
jgi:hypothetical protein